MPADPTLPLDLGEIRIELERRRRALLARYLDERDGAPELLETRDPEIVERGTTEWYALQLERMSEQDRRRLELLDAARTRLDEGQYGRCLICRAPIEPARLRAVPDTPFCLAHALTESRPAIS